MPSSSPNGYLSQWVELALCIGCVIGGALTFYLNSELHQAHAELQECSAKK